MLNTIKILMVFLVCALLMPFGSTLSYGYQGYSGGHFGGHSASHFAGHFTGHGYRGFGGRGYGNFGLAFNYNYSPYYYNPTYYPYYSDYYDTGVIVSSPVVETPVVTEIAPVQMTTTDTGDDIIINIPNSAGSYTRVLIKRSGKGFVGPQGEYYSEFPKVSVLKVIYGK